MTKIKYFVLLLALLVSVEVLAAPPVTLKMQQESDRIRKEYNLKPQILDKECCKTAQEWAEYMAKHHYFSHGGGENIIAVGYESVPDAFQGWMLSSGHRYWLLSDADRSGWGAAKSNTGRWYWAGAFRKDKVKFQLPTATTTYVPKYRFRLFRKRR